MTTERINVTAAWRLTESTSTFTMKFSNPADMNKAYKAMKTAIETIGKDFYKGYLADLWLQDLGDCCEKNNFDIVSALSYEAFVAYIPAMCKAVAEAMPDVAFEGTANYDDLKCYCIQNFDFTYENNTLTITSEFMDDDCGYFCPDCGYQVGLVGEDFDDEEIECDDCEETIKVCDLVYVAPITEKNIYIIK